MEGNGVKAGLFLMVVGVFFYCWRYDCFASCPGPPGSLLVFDRGPYQHYAVVVYYGYIIHYTSVSDVSVGSFDVLGSCCGTEMAEIREQKCSDLSGVNPEDVKVENEDPNGKSPLPVWKVIERAYSKIGEKGYSLMWNNCEHFARWCRYGEKSSDQADGLMKAGLLLAVVAVCWFGRNLFNLLRSRWLVPHFQL